MLKKGSSSGQVKLGLVVYPNRNRNDYSFDRIFIIF